MDEEDLFAQAMGKVRKLKTADKIHPEKPKPKRDIHSGQFVKKSSALLPPPTMEQAPEAGEEPWILKSSGVSREKLKALGAGRPPIDLESDLHGLNREQALAGLARMFDVALAERLRVLCIVHGRGLHSQGKAVLKEAVYEWLRSGPYAGHILAVIPKPYTGGGSALVLLRRQRER